MILRFFIPGVPPSVNHMYRNFTHRGRRMRVLTYKAEQWMREAKVAPFVAEHRLSGDIGSLHMARKGEQVVLRLWFYWPDRRRRDTHNALKALLDAFEGVLYEDDKDVLPQIMGATVDRENPRIEVEVAV